jgi:FtsH-binding integral membrane protein
MALGPDNRFPRTSSAWTAPLGRTAGVDAAVLDEGLRAYMLRVYNWMASGLLLTGIVAFLLVNTGLYSLFFATVRTPAGLVASPTILGWVAMFSPLAFILVLSFGINRLSTVAAQALFWAFCAVMGASLTSILLTFTGQSVATTFFITAGTFAAMSLIGYTTQRDLTKMGSFLLMGLIGIILAGVVNLFLGSPALQFAISVIGVLVFVGLIAYDTQRIKNDYIEYAYAEGTEVAAKRSVMDALALYLNFINLFQFLISLIGQRQE